MTNPTQSIGSSKCTAGCRSPTVWLLRNAKLWGKQKHPLDNVMNNRVISRIPPIPCRQRGARQEGEVRIP